MTTLEKAAISIRAISPSDSEELRAMFARLSPHTIYYRFHMPYPAVPRWACPDPRRPGREASEPRNGARLEVGLWS